MYCKACNGNEFVMFGESGFRCKTCETPLHHRKSRKKKPKCNKKKMATYQTIENMAWETNSTVNGQSCTVVLTPHFKQRWEERCSQISKDTIIEMCKTIIETSNHGRLNGTPLRSLDNNIIAFIYTKKIFNKVRKRWELEMVSLTPSKVFQTDNTEEKVEWIEVE